MQLPLNQSNQLSLLAESSSGLPKASEASQPSAPFLLPTPQDEANLSTGDKEKAALEGIFEPTGRSEGGSSILDKGATKSGVDLEEIERDLKASNEDNISVLFRKCACNTSWCPICGRKRLVAMLLDIFKTWDWGRVRYFPLTIDRDLYTSPLHAYFAIQRSKELAEFMRRVKRALKKEGLIIKDYFWVLEWHDDGYGHWHFYVQVNRRGKAGRINKKVNLTEAWGRARHVQEGYIKDLSHWKATLGYAAKHGYFADGKKKQAILPDWAKALPKEGQHKVRIKRFERMRRNLRDGQRRRTDERPITLAELKLLLGTFDGSIYCQESGEFENPLKEEKSKTWEEVLNSCGAQSLMTVDYKRFMLTMRIDFPYKKVKKLPGWYVEGKGYVVDLSVERVMELLNREDKLIFYERYWFEGSGCR